MPSILEEPTAWSGMVGTPEKFSLFYEVTNFKQYGSASSRAPLKSLRKLSFFPYFRPVVSPVLDQHPSQKPLIFVQEIQFLWKCWWYHDWHLHHLTLKESAIAFPDAIRQVNTTERLNVSHNSITRVNTLPEPFHQLHQAAPVHGGLHHHHKIVKRHGYVNLGQPPKSWFLTPSSDRHSQTRLHRHWEVLDL